MTSEEENEFLRKEILQLRCEQAKNEKFLAEVINFIYSIDDCQPYLRQHCKKDFLQKHKLLKKENDNLILDSDSKFLEILVENMPKIARKRTEKLIANGKFSQGSANTIIIGPLLLCFHGMKGGSVRVEISNLRTENLTHDIHSGKIKHFNSGKGRRFIELSSDIHEEKDNIL